MFVAHFLAEAFRKTKNDELRLSSLLSFYDWLGENIQFPQQVIRSPILGKEGNTEYFFYFDKKSTLEKFNKFELEKL